MRWTERQHAMLREMGIPAFWPVMPAVPDVPTALADAPVPAPAPAPPLKPAPVPVITAAPAPTHAVARPAGLDVLDWPALRAAVAQCQACALGQGRMQSVFGAGHIEADWMIVGEAPGESEDKLGEPCVGDAAELLDHMLEAVGITRAEAPAAQQVFLTNALKCRPPANRNPLPPEVAQCEPYLLRQMALVQPRVVLAMGRLAVQSLLKSNEPLGKLRGRVHEVQGVPIIVTYSLANLLRSPANKALAWDDLCLAREVLARSRTA